MKSDDANPQHIPSESLKRLEAEIARRKAAGGTGDLSDTMRAVRHALLKQKPEQEENPVNFATETTHEPAKCEGCEKQFSAAVFHMNGARTFTQRYCEKCMAAEEQRQKESIEADRHQGTVDRWSAICPAEYRENDLLRIRTSILRKNVKLQSTPPRAITLDEIWRHEPGKRAISIIGKTGQCKTRIMFELLRRYHFERKLRIVSINAVKFADDLAAAYENGAGGAERWMKKIENAQILFIDDLGKEKLTERVEATYYRVVEHRTSNRLPIFFTANISGNELIKKWQQNAERQGFFSDRAEPIVRRLREVTDSITITDL